MTKRIGFACKFIPDWCSDTKTYKDVVERYNYRSTTITHLKKQSMDKQIEKCSDLLRHNAQAMMHMLRYLSEQPMELRMKRIGSEICTAYTHEDFKWIWQRQEMQDLGEALFRPCGDFARKHGIRLSFHPGQYTIINSENPDVVRRSCEEMEYHTDVARWLGYCDGTWHPHGFAINIHVGAKNQGVERFRENARQLSSDCRNLMTLENDEMSFGLDDTLKLGNDFALVLDIHHHFINSEGEYIQASDERIKRVIDSWRGVRPKFHLSTSREDILEQHCSLTPPDYKLLLEAGHKKAKLRAHSDYCWNQGVNDWAITHLEWADCMVEAKMKNLAQVQLYNRACQLGVL